MLKKVAFFAALVITANAQAAHYGMAGCGLGSMVFKDQPGKIQIVASTVNNIVSPQTFAISSGTSGCFEDGSSSAHLKYIETNKVALQNDVSRGSGETLDGLMTILGCQNQPAVKSSLKKNYDQIFTRDSAPQIMDAIKNNSQLKQNCSRLS